MGKDRKKRNRTIRTKIISYCIIFTLILSALLGAVGYITYRNNMIERYQGNAADLLHVIAAKIDGDKMQKCIQTKKPDEAFKSITETLYLVTEKSSATNVYGIYMPDKQAVWNSYFLIYDGLHEKENYTLLPKDEKVAKGDFDEKTLYSFRDALYEEKKEGKVHYITEKTDQYGYVLLSSIAIRDSKGKPVFVLCLDMNMDKVETDIRSYLVVISIASLLLLCIYLFVFILNMSRTIVNPINAIVRSSKDFVQQMVLETDPEKLEYNKNRIDTHDELDLLSSSINFMTDEIKDYMINLKNVVAEKERIGAELNVATKIQADMLPQIFPAFPERKEIDIYATMDPAKEVGGDFYDFFMVDDDHVAIVIGDVSGKGVPAALFMVISKTIIKNYTLLGLPPDEVFNRANKELCEGNEAGLFTTAWLGILEISTGKIQFADAGHDAPIRRKLDGTMEFVEPIKKKLVLAGFETTKYILNETKLESGELLLLYTDGVPEATDANNELYNLERLNESMTRHKSDKPEELLHHIREDVDAFVGEAPQFDDLTMLAIVINHQEK